MNEKKYPAVERELFRSVFWLALCIVLLSGCNAIKRSNLDLTDTDSTNAVKIEVPESWSSELSALELCVERPVGLSSINRNDRDERYSASTADIYYLNAFGVQKSGVRKKFTSHLRVKQNKECFSIGVQGNEKYKYIELSSNKEIALDKASWSWFYLH